MKVITFILYFLFLQFAWGQSIFDTISTEGYLKDYQVIHAWSAQAIDSNNIIVVAKIKDGALQPFATFLVQLNRSDDSFITKRLGLNHTQSMEIVGDCIYSKGGIICRVRYEKKGKGLNLYREILSGDNFEKSNTPVFSIKEGFKSGARLNRLPNGNFSLIGNTAYSQEKVEYYLLNPDFALIMKSEILFEDNKAWPNNLFYNGTSYFANDSEFLIFNKDVTGKSLQIWRMNNGGAQQLKLSLPAHDRVISSFFLQLNDKTYLLNGYLTSEKITFQLNLIDFSSNEAIPVSTKDFSASTMLALRPGFTQNNYEKMYSSTTAMEGYSDNQTTVLTETWSTPSNEGFSHFGFFVLCYNGDQIKQVDYIPNRASHNTKIAKTDQGELLIKTTIAEKSLDDQNKYKEIDIPTKIIPELIYIESCGNFRRVLK